MDSSTRFGDDTSQQIIHCCGSDTKLSFPVYASDVQVEPSKLNTEDSNIASNKVKVSQISKFEWVEKYYLGNLVSCNSDYVAYVLRVKSNLDDHVRVLNHHTSERVLLRGFKKNVVDVSFESFKSNKLACVDSEGTLFIFDILEKNGKLTSTVILQVSREEDIQEASYRVIWAPNLLLPMDSHEPMVALSSGNRASVFHLKKIHEAYIDQNDFAFNDIKHGVVQVQNCHKEDITCLALSPDTQVLATASYDGDVKFWSIKFDDDNFTPSCLHEWEPHEGRPVSCLFFCDNLLLGDDTSPFWRFLITATDNNSLLKIWCAVKWECVQTIRFCDYVDGIQPNPCLKVSLDLSAKYLILSDIYRSVLYICNIHQDTDKDLEKTSIISLSEFILRDPLLSFSICVAKERKSHSVEVDHDMTNGEADDSLETKDVEKEEVENHSVVTLFAIQKRALSKYSIKYKPKTSIQVVPPSISSASQDDLSIRDALSDIESVDTSDRVPFPSEELVTGDESVSLLSSLTEVSLAPRSNSPAEISQLDESISAVKNTVECKDATLIEISSQSEYVFNSLEDNSVISESLISGIEKLSFDVSSTVSAESATHTVAIEGSQEEYKDSKEDPMLHENEIGDEKPATETHIPNFLQETVEGSLDCNQVVLLLQRQQTLINSQQAELKEIKEMLKDLLKRESHTIAAPLSSSISLPSDVTENDREDMKVYMQLIQKSANSQFSKAVKEFNKLCTQRLDQVSKDLNSSLHSQEERIQQQLANSISSTIAIKLDKIIKHEMKQTVLNGLEKIHSRHLDNMTNQIAQRMSVWERTLREETQELIKSKPLVESIGYAAASILEITIPAAYKESFQKVLLPGFEKASMAMFMQINQTFQQGTKQYLERLESHLEMKRQRSQDQQDPLISNLQDLVHSFQGTADRLTAGVESNLEALMQKQLRDTTDRMQLTFSKTIESKIVPSLSKTIFRYASDAFNEWKSKIDESLINIMQNSSVANISVGAENRESTEARLTQFIQNGNYNSAFEAALTASDLSLVMFLCKLVDPTTLFQQDRKLPQPIILSLIQQLSVNLWEETEVKRKYLEEAFMALDVNDEITKEHLPGVLKGFIDQLCVAIDSFIKNDPSNQQIKPLKMLLMASKSLLHGDN